MVAATQQSNEQLCTACFSGVYPIELPAAEKLGKDAPEPRNGILPWGSGPSPGSSDRPAPWRSKVSVGDDGGGADGVLGATGGHEPLGVVDAADL